LEGRFQPLPGAILGAIILIGLPEVLREFKAGDFRNIIIGIVLFGVILFQPRGLIGEVSALDFIRNQFGLGRKTKADGKQMRVGWL
jgi:branched-chain amino acid transport system permease protein